MTFSLKCLIFTFIFLLFEQNLVAQTLNFNSSIASYETGMTISAGAYQSYINSYIHLKRKGSTPILKPQESLIYRYLIGRLTKPGYLLFQASAYPLAALSSQLETFHPHEFNRFKLMGWNILRSVGAGPEEPYALSVLLGNLAFFGFKEETDGKIKMRQLGAAMAGIVITTGHLHLYENIRIDDRWWQTELILTGNLKEPNMRKIFWNFRIGTKFHKNKMAPDVIVLALQRNHTDWHYRGVSFLRSSIIRYEAHFPIGDEWRGSPFTIRQLLTYGKKIPFKIFGRFMAVRLGGGVLWEWIRKYDHQKRMFEPKETSHLVWLMQPSLEF